MPFIETLAQQAAGGILGIGLQSLNDSRQLRQQGKLNRQQLETDKKMSDYQYQKQLEMWKATNFSAQMEELRKAGLNPGLLYGMSGAGGATTGAGAASSKGANAPAGGGEIMGMMGATQIAAQTELIKAQTEKTKAETVKTAGVDTQESQTRIESLKQGITNTETQRKLTEVETILKQLDVAFQGESLSDRLDQVEYTVKRTITELENAQNTTYINRATRDAQIKIVRTTAIEGVLRNSLISAQTTNVQQQTEESKQRVAESQKHMELMDAQIKELTERILQNWDSLDIQEYGAKTQRMSMRLQETLNKWNMEHPDWHKMIGHDVEKAKDWINETTRTIQNILDKITAPNKR